MTSSQRGSGLVCAAKAARFRELALEYAERLRSHGYDAIAATGSVARGDAIEGSDLDLWVIADRNEIVHDSIDGTSVTIFFQPLATATGLTNLSLFDVESLWVIVDVRRVFDRIRSAFRKNRKKILAGIFDATLLETYSCLQLAREGSARSRLVHLREAAMRLASLKVGRETGIRVPRYRHFRQHYSPRLLHQLRRALGVEHCGTDDIARIVARTEPYTKALERYLRRRVSPASRVAVPLAGIRRLREGQIEEGVLSLRVRFEQQCMIPLRTICSEPNLVDGAILKLPRPVTDFYDAIHLFRGSSGVLAGQVNRAKLALAALVRGANIEKLLSPCVYLD